MNWVSVQGRPWGNGSFGHSVVDQIGSRPNGCRTCLHQELGRGTGLV